MRLGGFGARRFLHRTVLSICGALQGSDVQKQAAFHNMGNRSSLFLQKQSRFLALLLNNFLAAELTEQNF